MHKIYIDKHPLYPFFTIKGDYAYNVFSSLLSKDYGLVKYPDFGCLDYDEDSEYNFRRALEQIKSDFTDIKIVVIDYRGSDEHEFLREVRDDIALDEQAACA